MKSYLLKSIPVELWAWVKSEATLQGETINTYILSLLEREKEKKHGKNN